MENETIVNEMDQNVEAADQILDNLQDDSLNVVSLDPTPESNGDATVLIAAAAIAGGIAIGTQFHKIKSKIDDMKEKNKLKKYEKMKKFVEKFESEHEVVEVFDVDVDPEDMEET